MKKELLASVQTINHTTKKPAATTPTKKEIQPVKPADEKNTSKQCTKATPCIQEIVRILRVTPEYRVKDSRLSLMLASITDYKKMPRLKVRPGDIISIKLIQRAQKSADTPTKTTPPLKEVTDAKS